MSADPGEALQRALYAFLVALDTEAAGRVFDTVPAAAAFPYISLGPCQVIPIDNDCGERSECYPQIDVWSREVGFPQVKRIAGAIRVALDAGGLAIAGHTVDLIQVRSIDYLRDPDGLTSRARILVDMQTSPSA